MAITMQPPFRVWLGGTITKVNDVAGSGSIVPGYLIERFNSSGTPKFRAHSTAGGNATKTVALNADMLNKGIDDAWADGDLIEAAIGTPGATFYMLIASGQNLVAGDFLESAGNGLVRKLTSGTPLFQVLVGVNNSAGPSTARVRAEAL